jgi:hypothetical protein
METKEYSDLLKKNIWTDQECKQVADYLVKKAGDSEGRTKRHLARQKARVHGPQPKEGRKRDKRDYILDLFGSL